MLGTTEPHHWSPQPGDPPWLAFMLALREKDTREVKGSGINPEIANLYRILGLDPAKYQDDTTPWCAIAANASLRHSGLRTWPRLFAALGALDWGVQLDAPRRGCFVSMTRVDPSQPTVAHGHVTLWLGLAENRPGWFDGCGGNQGNRVNINPYDSARVAKNGHPEHVVGYRWPKDFPL